MRDRPIVFAGLAVFLAMAGFPFWYSVAAGRTAKAPELKLPATGGQCVAPVAFMKSSHMELLRSWREQAVRQGQRSYTNAAGATFDISLTRTCLGQCHQDRAAFCDRCHSYMGLTALYCFDCHNSPPGVMRSAR